MNDRHFEYGSSLYKEDIKYWAKRCLGSLPKGTKHLVSSGSSGCALASAMLALSETPLTHLCLYLGEKQGPYGGSHRRSQGLPGVRGVRNREFVFVDDLLDRGRTFEYVQERIHSEKGVIGAAVFCRTDWAASDVLLKLNRQTRVILAGE